jgi:hypothetical protein
MDLRLPRSQTMVLRICRLQMMVWGFVGYRRWFLVLGIGRLQMMVLGFGASSGTDDGLGASSLTDDGLGVLGFVCYR